MKAICVICFSNDLFPTKAVLDPECGKKIVDLLERFSGFYLIAFLIYFIEEKLFLKILLPVVVKLTTDSSFILFFSRCGGISTLSSLVKIYLRSEKISDDTDMEYIVCQLLFILRNLAGVKEVKEMLRETSILKIMKAFDHSEKLVFLIGGIQSF